MTNQNKIKITYGDWSLDGHEERETVYYKINVSPQEFREMFFATANKYDDITTYCNEAGKNTMYNDDYERLGLNPENRPRQVGAYEFQLLFVEWMTTHNKNLTMVVDKDDVEDFHFCGTDDKGRHIGGLGYGCFNYYA